MSQEIVSKDKMQEALEQISAKFGLKGTISDILPIKTGHINETFLVSFKKASVQEKYIFQSINTLVFKDPKAVMSNIMAVTKHIKKKCEAEGLSPERRVLKFYKTVDNGHYYYIDEKENYWRIYKFVDNSSTFNDTQNPELLYNAGLAFGKFQRWLEDFPMDALIETIPDFHNTPVRLEQLKAAVKADRKGRAAFIEEEISFFNKRKHIASRLVNLQKKGILPLRVTHNDTKCNNVLMDDETNEGICVIDLDTVMPGLSAYDFGDAIRSCGTTAAEDESDLAKVNFNVDNFESFAKGFLEASEGFFTQAEIDNMVWGAIIMTLECGSRFLADYLNGDVYFKVTRKDQNLDRARTHIKLIQQMEEKMDFLNEIVQREAQNCLVR